MCFYSWYNQIYFLKLYFMHWIARHPHARHCPLAVDHASMNLRLTQVQLLSWHIFTKIEGFFFIKITKSEMFWKFRLKSRFFEDYDCSRIIFFRKVWLKSKFFNDLDWNRDFRKLLLKSRFFDFFFNFKWNWDFSDIMTVTNIFHFFLLKLVFSGDFD